MGPESSMFILKSYCQILQTEYAQNAFLRLDVLCVFVCVRITLVSMPKYQLN